MLRTLRRTDAPWRSLLDALPMLVAYVDAEGRYGYNNQAYEDWFGRSRESISGRHVREVIGEQAYAVIKPYIERALAGEHVTYTREALYHGPGKRFIRATYVPDFAGSGRVRGFFALIEDMTEIEQAKELLRTARDDLQLRVEERTAQLRAVNTRLTHEVRDRQRAEQALEEKELLLTELFEMAPTLVVLTDADGHILLFNQACETATGYRREEVYGERLVDLLVPQDWKPMVSRLFEEQDTAQLREPHETPWLTRSGELRLIEWRGAVLPLPGHPRPGILAIGVDITQRRQADERARQQQEELARLLRVNTLGEMASALAHELNQPLAAVLGYTQGLTRLLKAGNADTQAVIETVTKAAQQARRAGDIIAHIRRVIRRDEPKRTMIDVNAVVRDVVTLTAAEASAGRISLRLDLAEALPPVSGERIAIEQVVLNLFHNAIEALRGRSVGRRRLFVVTRRGEAGTVTVTVRDNGPGVPASLGDQVFKPFVTSKPQGLGLGLSICRSIIRDHGGDLWFETPKTGGAAFSFALPARVEVGRVTV